MSSNNLDQPPRNDEAQKPAEVSLGNNKCLFDEER